MVGCSGPYAAFIRVSVLRTKTLFATGLKSLHPIVDGRNDAARRAARLADDVPVHIGAKRLGCRETNQAETRR